MAAAAAASHEQWQREWPGMAGEWLMAGRASAAAATAIPTTVSNAVCQHAEAAATTATITACTTTSDVRQQQQQPRISIRPQWRSQSSHHSRRRHRTLGLYSVSTGRKRRWRHPASPAQPIGTTPSESTATLFISTTVLPATLSSEPEWRTRHLAPALVPICPTFRSHPFQ